MRLQIPIRLKRDMSFFQELHEVYSQHRDYGPTFICGDLNARIYRKCDHDNDSVGDYAFYDANRDTEDASSNRALMIALCEDLNLKIANTFFEQEMSTLATYYELAANLSMPVSASTHAQIDFILCEYRRWSHILNI